MQTEYFSADVYRLLIFTRVDVSDWSSYKKRAHHTVKRSLKRFTFIIILK